MAEAELLATPTRTGLVGLSPPVLGRRPGHDFGGWTAVLEQARHHPHGGCGVGEEELQPRTEVVVARSAVPGEGEPVLRASPVAEVPDLATPTLGAEGVAFMLPEASLLRLGQELHHVDFVDVAQEVVRLDEVVAGVEVAVGLQSRAEAADRRMNAQEVAAEIGFQGHVKELDEDLTHVVSDPLLEDVHEKAAVLFASHRAIRDQGPGLGVQ